MGWDEEEGPYVPLGRLLQDGLVVCLHLHLGLDLYLHSPLPLPLPIPLPLHLHLHLHLYQYQSILHIEVKTSFQDKKATATNSVKVAPPKRSERGRDKDERRERGGRKEGGGS
jgi:hypothetical protein